MTGLYLAFTTGLLGGLGHCVGMCGPIVAAFSIQGGTRRESAAACPTGCNAMDNGRGIGRDRCGLVAMYYNAGRVMTYVALGAMAGGLGSFAGVIVPLEGAQYAVMTGAGILMIIMGLCMAGAIRGLTNAIERHSTLVLRAARGVLDGRRGMVQGRFLTLGMILGFLPCGLSYTMLIGAAGAGGYASGALLMLAFGLGTVPAMFVVGLMAGRLGQSLRGRLYRAGGLSVAAMGVLYVYRGWVFYA